MENGMSVKESIQKLKALLPGFKVGYSFSNNEGHVLVSNIVRKANEHKQLVDFRRLSRFLSVANVLHIENCKLIGLECLNEITKLTILVLRNCEINTQNDFQQLHKIEALQFINCNIKSYASFASLTSLIALHFEKNKRLPNDIEALQAISSLIELGFNNCNISDISFLHDNLPPVSHLDLRNNKISQISLSWLRHLNINEVIYEELSKENTLNLYGNPLEQGMIDAIQSGGKQALINYLEAKERGTVKIEEAKMVLLGEPRAGKTTLQKYLMGLDINENEPSTHDIQISTWKPFEHQKLAAEGGQIKINLWDFGGQEIQYSLHKMFMTEDTLYVIVLDSTKDQSPQQYLTFLEHYAPKAPFIIINNRGDEKTGNNLKLDENALAETYNGQNNKPVLKKIFSRVSVLKATKGDPSWRKIMDEVETSIKNEILGLEKLNKEYPKEYLQVKQAIETQYQKPNKHYISMSVYRELCVDIKNDEGLRTSILDYLNEIGVLRYFKDSPLTERHILNPKWLIEGAYALLIDPETEKEMGVLSKHKAFSILKRSDLFDFFEDEAEYIFRTMNHFGLLYFEESEQKVYIPIRFGSKQPIALSDFYEQGQHFMFEFKGDIPEDVIPTLIVRHFTEIRNQQYWRHGAVFEKEGIRILAKVEDRSIHFYIKGLFHQSYFGILRHTFLEILKKMPGLPYDEMVDFEFEGKKIKAKYSHLIKALERNRDYFDNETDVEITTADIIKILGGYFSSREVNQIINHNYYAPVYNSETLIQQNWIIHQLETTANECQSQELKDLIAEIQALTQEKSSEKKGNLGRKLLNSIKRLGTIAKEEAVKEAIKKTFPDVLETAKDGFDWAETNAETVGELLRNVW